MSFEDRTLRCVECDTDFTFTTAEQEFHAQKGYTHDPKRCPSCREARRGNRYGPGASAGQRTQRQMFPAVCAQCGADTTVPFQPRGDKPVYCSDCYSKMRPSSWR
ncbi:MAG: zinc-ribbon domain containing protein [Chloroflexi bacterium]|nr:zinc-ribbon domain containing protein [Chloroflexota bacterium]